MLLISENDEVTDIARDVKFKESFEKKTFPFCEKLGNIVNDTQQSDGSYQQCI